MQDPAQDSPRTAGLPARIREIVTRHLSQPESQGATLLSTSTDIACLSPLLIAPFPWSVAMVTHREADTTL